MAVYILEYFLSCQWKKQNISARLISVRCSNSDILKCLNNCQYSKINLHPCFAKVSRSLQFYGSIPRNCIFLYVSVFCCILKHFKQSIQDIMEIKEKNIWEKIFCMYGHFSVRMLWPCSILCELIDIVDFLQSRQIKS